MLQLLSHYGESESSVHAKNILPLRKRANLLLCTLVLGNTVVNNFLTLMMDNLIDSIELQQTYRYVISVAITLCLIMTFGEIIPQAVGMK